MKLLLFCHLLDSESQPFKIINPKTKIILKDVNPALVSSVIKTINLETLKTGCKCLNIEFRDIKDINALDEEDISFLHHVLFEIEVISGFLESQNEKHQIVGGIPDLEI